MKFTIETSKPGDADTVTVSATNRQEIENRMTQARPDMEWSASEMHDRLIGKKYRADGSGTEEIIIVTPV